MTSTTFTAAVEAVDRQWQGAEEGVYLAAMFLRRRPIRASVTRQQRRAPHRRPPESRPAHPTRLPNRQQLNEKPETPHVRGATRAGPQVARLQQGPQLRPAHQLRVGEERDAPSHGASQYGGEGEVRARLQGVGAVQR